jgi:uncharacterized protein YpiB (UPF0302 family)
MKHNNWNYALEGRSTMNQILFVDVAQQNELYIEISHKINGGRIFVFYARY